MPPPHKFLRSGKNQCDIRAKHKNFGNILICPENIFVSLRKLRDVRENVLICPAKFKHKNLGKILICPENIFVSLRKLRDVRENVLICPAKFSNVCRKVFGMSGKIFLVTSPPRQQFWGEILMLRLVRANYTAPPPKQD